MENSIPDDQRVNDLEKENIVLRKELLRCQAKIKSLCASFDAMSSAISTTLGFSVSRDLSRTVTSVFE